MSKEASIKRRLVTDNETDWMDHPKLAGWRRAPVKIFGMLMRRRQNRMLTSVLILMSSRMTLV
jgi:hypothetical protein